VLIAAIIAATYVMLPQPKHSPARAEFEKFKETFDKQYSKSEEIYRFTIFQVNLKKIEQHNADNTQTYKMDVNQFTDMTQEEFVEKILTKMNDLKTLQPKIFIEETYEPVPNGVDWRTQGVVSPIKNQGSCGSCWSFSTTGLLESTYKLKKGTLPSFSEQQLVDCCGKKGFQCQGCNGAWPEWALNYVNSAGIVSESSYPYKGVEGACQPTTGQKILNPSKPWTMVAAGNTGALKSTVAAGPVSICVDASNWSAYKSGVFSNCGTTNLNHAVLLVGYNDSDQWFVKNSWGTSWGSAGYITLAAGNTCGLANHAIVANF